VPNDWQYKECVKCHERTNRRRLKGKVPIAKIEQKAIDALFKFEDAYKNYRKFSRKFKMKGKSKEEFRKEWFFHNQPKIQRVKETIDKYNERENPLMSVECLEFRRLFAIRCGYVDYEKFGNDLTGEEFELFHNHLSRCESCNRYAVKHRDDAIMPINDFKEEGVSQQEFDRALDDFFGTINESDDPLEDAIHRAYPNLKPYDDKQQSQQINENQQINKYEPKLLEDMQREYEEGKAEVERINKLSPNKLKKWLEETNDGET